MDTASKIEIGWEGLTALLSAIAVAGATVWGAVQANEADIRSMQESVEIIREDTQYLRGRFDAMVERERDREAPPDE